MVPPDVVVAAFPFLRCTGRAFTSFLHASVGVVCCCGRALNLRPHSSLIDAIATQPRPPDDSSRTDLSARSHLINAKLYGRKTPFKAESVNNDELQRLNLREV